MEELRKIMADNNISIRKTADKKVSVLDVIREVGQQKAPRVVWKRIKEQYPSIVTKCNAVKFVKKGRFSERATPETPVMDKAGILELLQVLPGQVGDKFRAAVAQLVVAYLDADVSLTESMIDRTENIDDLKRIEARAKAKLQRKVFVSVLAQHGVSKQGYSICTNAIYTPIFGGDRKHIQRKKHLPETANVRDHMTAAELASVNLAEYGAEKIIKNKNLYGDTQCANACTQSARILADAMLAINKLAGGA